MKARIRGSRIDIRFDKPGEGLAFIRDLSWSYRKRDCGCSCTAALAGECSAAGVTLGACGCQCHREVAP